LIEILPGDMAKIHFTSGGSEATDKALKIASESRPDPILTQSRNPLGVTERARGGEKAKGTGSILDIKHFEKVV
jgi:adenosylmethionine-8-amino-7-oxononanoate aminotransferase